MVSKKFINCLPWVLFFALVIWTYFIYSPALSFPFQYDDFSLFVLNRGLRYWQQPELWLGVGPLRYRPFTALSYVIDHAVADLSISRFHQTNIFLHCANLLIFVLILRATKKISWLAIAIACASLATMPLLGESVVYVSARSALLAAFFTLLAFWSWQKSLMPEAKKILWLGVYVIAFFGGLGAKESAAVIPLLALLWLIWYSGWREIYSLRSIVFCLIPIFIGIIILWMKRDFLFSILSGRYNSFGELTINGYGEWLRLQLSLWPRIFAWFIFPDKTLSIVQQVLPAPVWLSPSIIFGFIFITIILFFIIWSWRKRIEIAPALIFFFLAALPTNSFIPIVDPLAERHFYLAAWGFGWALAVVIELFFVKLNAIQNTRNYSKTVTAIVFCTLFFSSIAWQAKAQQQQLARWRGLAPLWLDAYAKNPDHPKAAMSASMQAAAELGNYELSLEIALDAYFRMPYGGAMLWVQNRLGENAANSYLALASQSPNRAEEILNRVKNKFSNSEYWQVLLQAKLAQRQKNLALARKIMEGALKKNWQALHGAPIGIDTNFYQNIARLYFAEIVAEQKERTHAIDQLVIVLQQSINDELSYWHKRELLADLYLEENRVDEAIAQLEAVARQEWIHKRVNAPIMMKLGSLYEKKNDFTHAANAYKHILTMNAQSSAARESYIRVLEKSDPASELLAAQKKIWANNRKIPGEQKEEIDLIKP